MPRVKLNQETRMRFSIGQNGICHPENMRTTSIAEIEYWNENGMVHRSAVGMESGWKILLSEKTGCASWHADNPLAGISFQIDADFGEGTVDICVPQSGIEERASCRIKNIRPLPGIVAGREDDGSTLILPSDNGGLCRCRDKIQAEYAMTVNYPWPLMCSMPLWGIDRGNGSAVAAFVENGSYDLTFFVRTNWGEERLYSADAVFAIRDFLDDTPLADDIRIHYKILAGTEASYSGIARYYRDYIQKKRQLPTLKEKMQGNPTLAYSARALCLRCRMAVKQLPTPVLEQTPDTQPPMRVFMTFGNVRTLVEECARQKLGPIEFCLVGWNYGGHDGAFPQLFPVEKNLGGEKELRELLAYSSGLGYPMSLHDNYCDAYSLADNFDRETLILQHNGEVGKVAAYAGGQAYLVCPKCAYERNALNSLPKVAALGAKGTYYIDEISLVQLHKCYHPDHPQSRRDNVTWWKKLMGEASRHFGGFQSEGAREWALPELDRAYSVTGTTTASLPCIDEQVPFFQIAYHGFLIYNCFRSGINTFPGEDIYLQNLAYGGLPIVYYHQIHNPAWSAADGWDRDLEFGDMERLRADVARIKQITDDIAKLATLQTEFIDDFIRHSPTLTETIYSNGARVFVNYAEKACNLSDGGTVPPKNFLVITK